MRPCRKFAPHRTSCIRRCSMKPASLPPLVGLSRDLPAAAGFKSIAISRNEWSARPETVNSSCSGFCRKALPMFIAIPERRLQGSGQTQHRSPRTGSGRQRPGHPRRPPASLQRLCRHRGSGNHRHARTGARAGRPSRNSFGQKRHNDQCRSATTNPSASPKPTALPCPINLHSNSIARELNLNNIVILLLIPRL